MHIPEIIPKSCMSPSLEIFSSIPTVYQYFLLWSPIFNKTGELNKTDHQNSAPPAYNCETPQKQARKIKRQKKEKPITATDVPQWKWTKSECQEWYRCIFVKYLGHSDGIAEYVAKEISGWGPSIFSRNEKDWTRLLGEGRGPAMYNLIYKVRRKRGAIPWGISTDECMLANIH
ncbi:hypothetical protein LOCC1_G007551 [Lachnellula occidentalis]|uniref:Uncharacterized protein n=1 Tax=Lachnellula occidentalis TaxID=215460 RepID=A0A8H8UAR7_9HELO|nr:hypothetical protein LOCC1_G007551 [Lachnellula occidentalis]